MVRVVQRMRKRAWARKRQVEIDFAPGLDRHQSKTEMVLGLMAMLAWVVLGWSYQSLSQEHEAQQALEQQLLQTQKQARTNQQPLSESPWQHTQRMAAASVLAQLDIPWSALFHDLENAYDDKVTLISVEPDASRRDILITAEAADWSSMLNYSGQVRESENLRNAHITGHQVNLQDPQRPVRFTILAQWAGGQPTADSPTGARP